MSEQLSQDLSQKPESVVLDRETVETRTRALRDLVDYGNFKTYAETVVGLTERALSMGNLSLADRLGNEVVVAMQNHALANIAEALAGNGRANSIQTNLQIITENLTK